MKMNKINYFSKMKTFFYLIVLGIFAGLCVSCVSTTPGNYYSCDYPYGTCSYGTSYYYGYKYYYPYQSVNPCRSSCYNTCNSCSGY